MLSVQHPHTDTVSLSAMQVVDDKCASPFLVPLDACPFNFFQEPSPEVVACINNGEDHESAHEEEREESGLVGQWQDGGGDMSSLDNFLASGWGTD